MSFSLPKTFPEEHEKILSKLFDKVPIQDILEFMKEFGSSETCKKRTLN